MRRDSVPSNDNDLSSFVEPISAQLTAAPTAFGCTAAMATQLASLLSDFNTKLAAAQNPETRGHSTIFAKNTSKTALVDYLRMVIRQIQGTSTVTDQQRTDLGINVRKNPPTWPGDPGTPYKFKAELTELGALAMSWKCTNPASGTMYQVFRKIGTAEPVYLGGSGNKKFVDSTLPAGSSQVTYQIQAIRCTGAGAWATFNVNIGVGGSTSTAAVNDAVKMAA